MSEILNQVSPNQLSRRDVLKIWSLAAANTLVWGTLLEWLIQANAAPGTPEESPVATLPALPEPTDVPQAKPEVQKVPKSMPENPYRIGPLNLQGLPEGDPFWPAPPLFLFIKLENTIIKSYVFPKMFKKGDDPKAIFDWHNQLNPDWRKRVNASFINVTARKNGYQEGFLVQTGESGSPPLVGDLQLEGLLKLLEGDARFTKEALAAKITSLKSAEVKILQGEPLPAAKIEGVDWFGRGLFNWAQISAKITGVMRLTPQRTEDWEQRKVATLNQPEAFVNVLDYAEPKDRLMVNPWTDFVLEFCGQKTLPGENRVPGVDPAQTSRYFLQVSLLDELGPKIAAS